MRPGCDPCNAGQYGYYSGQSAPPEPLVIGVAELRQISVVTGPLGATLIISGNCAIPLPPNFCFSTDKFCDKCCQWSITLTGDVTFFFISFCLA